MELTMKHWLAFLSVSVLALVGCETTGSLGEPIRTIENPYNEEQYKKISDSYVREMEVWRKDAESVCQIEIYKLEGKNAVLLDRKTLKSDKKTNISQITTRKYIYVFHLTMPEWITQAWWVERIDVYNLPSQRPEENPALNTPTPEMRDPKSLTPLEDPDKAATPSENTTLP